MRKLYEDFFRGGKFIALLCLFESSIKLVFSGLELELGYFKHDEQTADRSIKFEADFKAFRIKL